MDKIPEYLFHYTSIENLCLILKNKTIRFSRLDKVNDLEEGLTKNFPEAKYFTYVSSWTSEKRESLPMWKMYSDDMKGLRIRLPINMFKDRQQPEYETTGFPIIPIGTNIKVSRKKFFYSSLLIGPFKIDYKLNPLNTKTCFTLNKDKTVDVELLHLGLTKRKYWTFEKEWRYKIIGMPFEGKWLKEDYDKFLEHPTNEYIDLPLDQSVFSELIVQLGPRANLAESEIVRLLLKEYAPGSKCFDSSCKIKK
jgi:hypothetical protein